MQAPRTSESAADRQGRLPAPQLLPGPRPAVAPAETDLGNELWRSGPIRRRTVSTTTLANCRPEGPQYHSSEHDRKYPGQDGRQHDDPRAEGQTDEGSDEHEFERQASVQFLDHEGTVAGGDR